MEYTKEERTAIINKGLDFRNVRDRYKDMPQEDIIADAESKRSELVICASNKIRDINWGSVVRTVNALGAESVVFTGKRSYDRRGAVGAQNYTEVKHYETPAEAFAAYRAAGYQIIAAEYDDNYEMHSLPAWEWSEKTLVIFGEEGLTLDDEILSKVDAIVAIPMFGTVRSLNVANCVGMFIYDYNLKTGRTNL